jgi:hypothetical protein
MSAPRPIDQIEFVGLIGNRLLTQVTTNEFMNALAKNGWGEAQNAHILMRLRERGHLWGIRTPDDFARALRDGITVPDRDGALRRVCCHGQCWVIYRGDLSRFITIRHPSG